MNENEYCTPQTLELASFLEWYLKLSDNYIDTKEAKELAERFLSDKTKCAKCQYRN